LEPRFGNFTYHFGSITLLSWASDSLLYFSDLNWVLSSLELRSVCEGRGSSTKPRSSRFPRPTTEGQYGPGTGLWDAKDSTNIFAPSLFLFLQPHISC
jgi:hypothetical protein